MKRNQSLVEDLNKLFVEPQKPKAPTPAEEGGFKGLLKSMKDNFGADALVGDPRDNGSILIVHIKSDVFQDNQKFFEMESRQDWIHDNGCHLVSTLYNSDPGTVKLCFCLSKVLEPSDSKIPGGGNPTPEQLQSMK